MIVFEMSHWVGEQGRQVRGLGRLYVTFMTNIVQEIQAISPDISIA